MTISWASKTIKIKDLKEYSNNPRKITKKEFEKLVRSIKEDGYHQRIMIDSDNTILGGHQRKKALLAAGMTATDTIDVLVPNRKLTEEEIDRINIRDNLGYGSFDFDILSSRLDLDILSKIGMDENMIVGFDFGETENDGGSSQGKDKKKSNCDCDCCKH